MRKILGVARLLLLCLAMYMLLVLPVFADGYYNSSYHNTHYTGGYPTNYPGKAQGSMYRASHPAYVPTYYNQGHVYHTQQVAQTAPMRRLSDPAVVRGTQTAPMRSLNNYSNQPTRQTPRNYNTNPYYRSGVGNGVIYTDRPRLQFDALNGPTQMITNGRPVQDPALVYLPPLYPQKSKRRFSQTKQVKNPGTQTKAPDKKVVPVGTKPAPSSVQPGEKSGIAPQPTNKPMSTPGNTLTNSPSVGISRPTNGQAPKEVKPQQTTPLNTAPLPLASPYEGAAPAVGADTANK